MNSLSLRGACPAARCCPLGGARPALLPQLLQHSPTLACHRLNASAAPWASALTSLTTYTAHSTARRPLHTGVAVRSAPNPGPSSRPSEDGSQRTGPHSRAGGRGREREEGRGGEGAQGRDGWQGRGPGRGGGGRQSGARPPAPSGRGRGWGRGSDPSRPLHLGQLQEYVRQGAKQWADDSNYEEFFRAFNEAGKVTRALPSLPSSRTEALRCHLFTACFC